MLKCAGQYFYLAEFAILKGFRMGMQQSAEKINQQQQDCGQYYDALDKLCSVVVKMNLYAIDGMPLKQLQKNFQKLAPVFLILCGEEKAQPAKKIGRPKKKPENTLPVNDGWGLCPTCGQKCIKVNDKTVLVNYPMYCKRCKRDYLVNWRL